MGLSSHFILSAYLPNCIAWYSGQKHFTTHSLNIVPWESSRVVFVVDACIGKGMTHCASCPGNQQWKACVSKLKRSVEWANLGISYHCIHLVILYTIFHEVDLFSRGITYIKVEAIQIFLVFLWTIITCSFDLQCKLCLTVYWGTTLADLSSLTIWHRAKHTEEFCNALKGTYATILCNLNTSVHTQYTEYRDISLELYTFCFKLIFYLEQLKIVKYLFQTFK